MPPKTRGETKSQRQARIAHEALSGAFSNATTQGRTPDLKLKAKTPAPPPLPAPSEDAVSPDSPHSWKTGLSLVIHSVQQHGFTHPYSDSPGYIMVPPEYEAVLSVENKACCQILFRIMRETIGQADTTKPKDEQGRFPRREWALISHQSFSAFCGMTPGQVNRGIKLALQKGYIRRRRTSRGFEYALRWKETSPLLD